MSLKKIPSVVHLLLLVMSKNTRNVYPLSVTARTKMHYCKKSRTLLGKCWFVGINSLAKKKVKRLGELTHKLNGYFCLFPSRRKFNQDEKRQTRKNGKKATSNLRALIGQDLKTVLNTFRSFLAQRTTRWENISDCGLLSFLRPERI